MVYDAIIIGGGVSGLVAANELGRTGLSILLLEKGPPYSQRTNQLEGIGGAGTLGGGKFCYPPASGEIWRLTDTTLLPSMCDRYISFPTPQAVHHTSRTFEKCYPSDMISAAEMSDLVHSLVSSANADIRTGYNVTGYTNDRGTKVISAVNPSGYEECFYSRIILFACGRSASSRIPKLLSNLDVFQQSPDLGIRLIMPKPETGLFSVPGQDIKLKYWFGNTQVRTFCVCSGGEGVIVDYAGCRYHDGHFTDSLTDIVDFGVLARSPALVGTGAAIQFLQDYQEYVERTIPLKDFINHWRDFLMHPVYEEIFSPIVQFLETLLLADVHDAKVLLPSVDRLNPIVPVNSSFETKIPGVYVIGDATGISRGYIQSMWGGYCAAQHIIATARISNAL